MAINTTINFAQAALNILRCIPDDKFNLNVCGSTKQCGCAVHWMYMLDILKTRTRFGWDANVARKRIMRLRGDTRKLRIILGFEPNETCELYKVCDLSAVSKAQVMQQLEVYLDEHA